ncbi:MAG: hypothetical protein ACM31C_07535 [Acidobacteriota bacterium]
MARRCAGMHRALLVLLVPAIGHAGPLELAAVPGPTSAPEVAASEHACEARDGAHLLRTRTMTLGNVTAEILHDCGFVPAGSRLAIGTRVGWFVREGFPIEDTSHMSVTPWHLHLVDESLASGSLADGRPAIVYRSVSRLDDLDSAGRVVAGALTADLLICRAGDTVECGRVSYACPATGCPRATFRRGRLDTGVRQ